jgi:hypothetical protein
MIWREQKWATASRAFSWWVWEVFVSQRRQLEKCVEWIDNRAYQCILTEEEWRSLLDGVRQVPDWRDRDIESIAEEFVATIKTNADD